MVALNPRADGSTSPEYTMGEYGYSGRKADFINTIMGTWSKNQNKFNKNMKNEEQVGDVIKNIKDIL